MSGDLMAVFDRVLECELELGPASLLESLGRSGRYADPQAPKPAREMAAGGALPLPPHEIVGVLFALCYDPDPGVSEKARQSLIALPDSVLDPTLGANVHPGVLAFLAERFREDLPRLETIALNSATSDETIISLAGLPYPGVIEIVSENQTRLLRCPRILEALGQNQLTSQATLDRIVQFLGLAREDSDVSKASGRRAQEAEESLGLDNADGLPPELLEDSEAQEPSAEGNAQATDQQHKRLLQSVGDMTVVEKIKLARFGNTEARALLIRDRNRLVALAAVQSPKLTEKEVVGWAKARQLSDDVIRAIATTRAWTRLYVVRHALASNPRTPLKDALRFVQTLNDRDLKALMKSRDVPSPVNQTARKLIMRKGRG